MSTAVPVTISTTVPILPPQIDGDARLPPAKRRASVRKVSRPVQETGSTNPDQNANILDAPEALRASPDASESDERMDLEAAGMDVDKQVQKEDDSSGLSDIESPVTPKKPAAKSKASKAKNEELKAVPATKLKEGAKEPQFLDPEADGDEEADEEEIQAALSRPPPVHSDFLPLPWKGRLGYACLNTYLRFSNPPVFSSRTCRIASILENRHPLRDPNAPPHATKNRPDREQPADVARGQSFVESLGIANAKDIVKMLRWNDRFGIRFLRLSSEMFPFASHAEYGYKLASFVSRELAEAGRVAAELGHRLTTHPGQYTQLGSPRKSVIDNALRDLDYHAELLSLLKMPPQQDRDAVMILHLGGVFGDKVATLNRFRENYKTLPQGVKDRLVLENDDVSWSVHELLPLCEELNIPMVLDFHHHNIIFDADQIREGSKDIIDLFPRILATWKKKNITPKMHYSEPTPSAITGRQRRKHNPRVATLPPCPSDMDLMIEAKDKEQAVFELMRTFKLPGYDTFNDIIPHVRKDDNKPVKISAKKKTPKKKSKAVKDVDEDEEEQEEAQGQQFIIEDEVGMGGPDGRVYWPPGMEDWLRPVKKVVAPRAPKEGAIKMTPAMKAAATRAANKDVKVESDQAEDDTPVTPATKKARALLDAKAKPIPRKAAPKAAPKAAKAKSAKNVPTPSISDDDDSDDSMSDLEEDEGELDEVFTPKKPKVNEMGKAAAGAKRQSGRAKKISYVEDADDV